MDLTQLWILKTAINIERVCDGNEWWQAYITDLMAGRINPDIDVLFGPWCDLSPEGIASTCNILGAIEGRGAAILGATAAPWKHLENVIEACRVIKIGFGTFLLIVWRGDKEPLALRASVLGDLVTWGWSLLGANNRVFRIPWNEHTCTSLMQIANPRRNIRDVMDEEGRY